MNRTIFFGLFLFALLSPGLLATDYDVGPGQPYAALGDVPWLTLGPGDQVKIHWKTEPYREKIGLRCRGTASQPIRIVGVEGPSGELPVLDGKNATTSSQFSGFFDPVWDEYLGVFLIKRGPGDPFGYKPGHLVFENLEITGANPLNSYTDPNGSAAFYSDGAAAIWAVIVENLVVRGCEITDNGNGLFVLSKNNCEEETSRDILVEYNHLHGNGVDNSWLQHNIYTQAAGIVFQYNRIGRLKSGALGAALKDRSSGTVIRYNWIESSLRTLDLVDAEDSYLILSQEDDYNQVYVYGNILINDTQEDPHSTRMIHFGGDSWLTDYYRKGPLYFYFNSVVIISDQATEWKIRLFDLPVEDGQQVVDVRNNILYLGASSPSVTPSTFYLMTGTGTVDLEGVNWISSHWEPVQPGSGGVVTLNGSLIEDTDPGFRDLHNKNFYLLSGSDCIDQAAPLPPEITTEHDLLCMYEPHQSGVPRDIVGTAMDLGGFEFSPLSPNPDIKANGGDGPLYISGVDPLSVTVELDPGDFEGLNADWWICAVTQSRVFSHQLGSGWIAGIVPSYQGPLAPSPSYEVLNINNLTAGLYTFYFGVDLVPNGTIDYQDLFYDTVIVDVSP